MAFLHDLVAKPTVKGTTFLGHKDALQPFLYTYANHRNHPPSISCHLIILPMRSKNLGVFTNPFWACQQDFGRLMVRAFCLGGLAHRKIGYFINRKLIQWPAFCIKCISGYQYRSSYCIQIAFMIATSQESLAFLIPPQVTEKFLMTFKGFGFRI